MKRRRRRHPDSLRLALDQLILAQAGLAAAQQRWDRNFAEVREILLHLVETLPDAIRSQIGFKPKQP